LQDLDPFQCLFRKAITASKSIFALVSTYIGTDYSALVATLRLLAVRRWVDPVARFGPVAS
jgi:hypothetical protein